jgi:hypothetical protein
MDVAKDYRDNYKKPASNPSCHCMTVPMKGGGDVSDNDNHFKHDISLGLIDIYGRPLKGNYSEFGQFQPKDLHDFQYASLNKNPSYFLDLSQNIGLRPVVRGSDIEEPPRYKYGQGEKNTRETACNQPEWGKLCM